MVDLSIVNKESQEFLGACEDGKEYIMENTNTTEVTTTTNPQDTFEISAWGVIKVVSAIVIAGSIGHCIYDHFKGE